MKPVIRIGTLFAMAACFCLAETWTGKLVDASCMDQQSKQESNSQKKDVCPATASTTAFDILLSDGQLLRLDSTGNAKAAAAMKNVNADQPVQATVSGDLQGHVVTVETISVQP